MEPFLLIKVIVYLVMFKEVISEEYSKVTVTELFISVRTLIQTIHAIILHSDGMFIQAPTVKE